MKEIDTIIPVDLTEIDKLNNDLSEKLKYLFSSPDFQKEVSKIRGEFNIPAYGIKGLSPYRKVSESEERKRNLERDNNLSCLMYDDIELKKMNIKKKSRKEAYQKSIRELRTMFKLPARYQKTFADYFIPYDYLPKIGSHSLPCIIRVYDDCGEKRLFIEIFDDTKKQDVVRAWKDVEDIKNLKDIETGEIKHKFNGRQLYRYKNFYRDRLLNSDQKVVDKMGFPIPEDDPNYYTKNIRKSRFRKHLKKDNSK